MTPFGPYAPDRPVFRDGGLIEALNLVPRSDGSYGPVGEPVPLSNALPARALALFAARDLVGNQLLFAGTETHLYRLEPDGDWLQVSKSGGYTLEIGAQERQRFCQFGDYVISAMGVGEAMQRFNVAGGSAFSDLSATAPFAVHVAPVRDFVMVANTFDPSQGLRPDQVWWCAIGNPLSWPTIGSDTAASVQSDRQVLADSGHLQGIVPKIGGRDAAIFGDQAVWTCNYQGPPIVFRFDPVEGSRGCYASGSLVRIGNVVYYLAEDGFYVFDGAQSQPIGRGVIDSFFLNDFDDSYREYMFGDYDPERGVIVWAYPGSGHTGGVPNKAVILEPQSGTWTRALLNADLIARATTIGYTLDGLDSLGFSIDELPFSLDSRVWSGGAPFFGIFDGTSHRLSTFGTVPKQVDVTTAEFSGQNGQRIWLDGLRIYTDAPSVSAAVAWRDTASGALNDTGYVAQDEDFIDHLVAARYARIKTRIPAGIAWTKLQGYEARIRLEGRR